MEIMGADSFPVTVGEGKGRAHCEACYAERARTLMVNTGVRE